MRKRLAPGVASLALISAAVLASQARADGKMRWGWRVLPGMHPVGKRTVHVECTLGDRSGSVDTFFDVRF